MQFHRKFETSDKLTGPMRKSQSYKIEPRSDVKDYKPILGETINKLNFDDVPIETCRPPVISNDTSPIWRHEFAQIRYTIAQISFTIFAEQMVNQSLFCESLIRTEPS